MIVSCENMEYNEAFTMDSGAGRPSRRAVLRQDGGMYERFFFLNEKPFHITPDPRFLYLSKKHREAIDLLSFGIRERKGFILLTGEVGTGKTTLCRAILERLPKGTESALILNPVLSDIELLKTITADFGIKAVEDTPKGHIDGLNSFLLGLASNGGNAVVIIDEAQNLSPAALEMVRLLSNLETEKEKLLQIILVGQPELKKKLAMTSLRQLNQRIIIRHHLEPPCGCRRKRIRRVHKGRFEIHLQQRKRHTEDDKHPVRQGAHCRFHRRQESDRFKAPWKGPA